MKDSLPENAKRSTQSKSPRRSGDYNAPRDNARDNNRQGRKPAPDKFPDIRGESAPRGAAGALIELDKDLMKLLVRRAKLVGRIRGGKDHASTPQAILEEKSVRTAWEANALSFSKDPRFSRQLFSLLQDLKVLSKEDTEGSSYFALAPSRAHVSLDVTAPNLTSQAQMWSALAASLGKKITLEPVLLADALVELVKAYAQGGALLSWKPFGALGSIVSNCDVPASFTGKNIYVGESALTLYLIAFATAGSVGVTSLTGGTALKTADLSALRTTLPLLGARLANKIPRSTGLPANIESSGMLPQHITIPADLPFEGVCALFLSLLVWNLPMAIDLSALPAATATSAMLAVQPIMRQVGANIEANGASLVFTPGPIVIPAHPVLDIDPALAGYLLALPAFMGGTATLKGTWNSHSVDAGDVQALLNWAGVQLTITPESIAAQNEKTPFASALHGFDIEGPLAPLYYILAAKAVFMNKAPVQLPFTPNEQDFYLVQDFYSRLDLTIENGVLTRHVQEEGHDSAGKSTGTIPWTSPNAYWTMAFSIAATLRPGLRLANPGSVTDIMPSFWGLYNALPNPTDPAVSQPAQKKEQADATTPARRRIIAE